MATINNDSLRQIAWEYDYLWPKYYLEHLICVKIEWSTRKTELEKLWLHSPEANRFKIQFAYHISV